MSYSRVHRVPEGAVGCLGLRRVFYSMDQILSLKNLDEGQLPDYLRVLQRIQVRKGWTGYGVTVLRMLAVVILVQIEVG